jgi:CubicO group peptidase (beta-lactamase class C family)
LPELIPLRPHPRHVPWPTTRWAEGELDSDVDGSRIQDALDRVFEQPWPERYGVTQAVVAIHHGVVVRERYAPEHSRDSTFISWSMAKSVLQCAIGTLVRDGKLDIHQPADVTAWRAPDDPRGAITVDQLLRMSSGLHFFEDYVDEHGSDCIRMLFGRGQEDVAAYAASQPLDHAPDTLWNYSSGTSNILSEWVGRIVGGGVADRSKMEGFLHREIFDRIGMQTATLRFDPAETWIASSFLFATARDFARFGYLYLRDGIWGDERLLPEGWVDYARTETPASGGEYGAHWWLAQDGSGRFNASGYRGQYIVVDPARDLVVVRLGESTPEQRANVLTFMRDVVESFPTLSD